jgi:hypothetical protein
VTVSRVSISGCLNFGIYLGLANSTVVDSCTARTIGGTGIEASTIKQALAFDCGDDAIFGYQVYDCQGESNSGLGVFANAMAQNCYGSSSSFIGVEAYTAQNCIGYGGGNNAGVDARNTALNCAGTSSGADGIDAYTAENCYGSGAGANYGINAYTAQNCYGTTTSGYGINADTALNCYGYATGSGGSGLSALTAQNCYGYSVAGNYGIYASDVASGCYGYCTAGIGINAFIVNVCHGATSTGTAFSTTHNVNSY